MPAIPGSVPVSGFIAPTDSADTYPSHVDLYGKGGYRVVADLTERDAIPTARRTFGMLVYSQSNGTQYIMGPGLTNAEWTLADYSGSAIQTLAALTALPVAGLTPGFNAYVAGFSAPGDGGGGVFYYDSLSAIAAIAGMVVIPSSGVGRWLRDYGPVLNARWFGAQGDAVVDDYAPLQEAIDFAEQPTYGWANFTTTFAEHLSMALYIPPGIYLLSATLIFTKCEIYGKFCSNQSNFTGTNLWARHGGHCVKWRSDAVNFQVGAIHDIVLQCSPENYQQNKIAITSVTNRFRFFVAPADSPLNTFAGPPNFCFFFDNQGTFLGHAVISQSNHGTGQIDIYTGFDSYATRTVDGGVLSTACTVVFSSILTENAFTNFIDPASAGSCGLYMENASPTVICVVPQTYNLIISQVHCGIRLPPASIGGYFTNVAVRYARFAAVCAPVEYSSTDHQWTQIYLDCSYATDYFRTITPTNALDNKVFQQGAVALYGFGPQCRVENYIFQYGCLANVYIDRCFSACFIGGVLDGTSRYGLLVRTAYVSPLGFSSADVLLSQTIIRTEFSSDDHDTLHTTAAIRIMGEVPTNVARPVPIFLDTLTCTDGGGGPLDSLCDIDGTAPLVAHVVRIGILADRLGATVINAVGGQRCQILDWRWSNDPALIELGPYSTANNSIANYSVAVNGAQALSVTTAGLEVRSSVGTFPLRLNRTDTAKIWALNISTDIIRLYNETAAAYGAEFLSTASANTWTIGLGGAQYNPRTSVIQAELASTTGLVGVLVTIASPAVFTKNAHGFTAGTQLAFTTTGALPTGLVAGTAYFVIAAGLTTNDFEVSATAGGAAINTSGSQSGTHSAQIVNRPAGTMFIIASRGSGNDTTAGGIGFFTPDAGASGGTGQATSQKFKIKREGHLNIAPRATDPTIEVAEGDFYPNSTSKRFRSFLNAKWGDISRNTIRAATGTTVTVTAADEVVTYGDANPVTINLPAGVMNERHTLKNMGAGTGTITPNGAETLFTTTSVATLAMALGDTKTIQWNGSFWLVL